jgi:hypothetical protein
MADSLLERVLLGLAAALALAGAVRFIAVNGEVVGFPYAVNYGEGVVLDQAVRVARGPGLYAPLEKPPYVVDNYTPLFPWLASFTLPARGVSFYGGRAISFLASLAVACCLYAMALSGREKRLPPGRVIGAGIVAAGLYTASGEALDWGALYRVDCLGVALSIAGFALIASGRRCAPLLAAPVFAASLAVLQSLVAAPIAAYGAAVVLDRRRGLWGAAALAALGAVGVAAGAAATGGGFLTHAVRYNALPFRVSAIWIKYVLPLLTYKLPLLAAAALAWVALRKDRSSLPFLVFAPVALLVALSIGRTGADVNYLLVPVAALAALVGRGMVRAPCPWQRATLAGLAAAQLALCLALQGPRIGAAAREAIAARDSRFLAQVAQIEGPVLFEEPSLALLSGRPVVYEPFMCTQLAALGAWNPAPLAAALQAQRYAAVQRTAWLRDRPGGGADVIWLGDRTVPLLAGILAETYAPGGTQEFSRPISAGVREAYMVWRPRGGSGE